ncbi:MAG: rRNA maturation RNase YbeY [Chloroflexota bacterium]
MEIEIQDEWGIGEEMVARLNQAVAAVLTQEGVMAPAALTLLLTGDERLQELNQQFLGLDEPTDVLSFPAGPPMPGMAQMTPYLGDIAVSVPRAAQQAAAGGHSLAAELQLLAVHGTLHLLGYDHAEPDKKEVMWAAQTTALERLGAA